MECPAHPATGRFHPVRSGCPGCAAEPEESEHHDANRYAEHAEAKQEADEAGLPTALGYERMALDICAEASSEIEVNRQNAEFCEARAAALVKGHIDVSVDIVIEGERMQRDATTTETEREAREWIKAAAPFRTNIRALIGERSKANRSALSAAAIRDSDAKLDARHREALGGRRAD